MLDIEAHTNALYERATAHRLGGDDRLAQQVSLRDKLAQVLGLDALKGRSNRDSAASLQIHRQDRGSYWEERVEIFSAPGVRLPCYRLQPKTVPPPGGFPVVLALQGHHPRGKEPFVGHYLGVEEKAQTEQREEDVGIQAVARGYAVLVPELLGFGELAWEQDRAADKKNSCAELSRRLLLMGRTLMGERVADLMQVLDYAGTLPDVNLERILVVGYSGGGTAAMFLASLDARVGAAVLVSSFCTYRASIVARAHCLCNVVPGILQLGEMSDLAGLIAPRPLLVVHGAQDPIYPAEATREAFSELQCTYAGFSQRENCQLVVGQGGHRFFAQPVWDFAQAYVDGKFNRLSGPS